MKDVLEYEIDEGFDEDLASKDAPDPELPNEEYEAAFDAWREQREDLARGELSWFFGEMGGRVPPRRPDLVDAHRAARRIHRWLKRLPAFHRGALSLRFTPKEWPPSLVRTYGGLTSLVVRLECTLHPSSGGTTTEELEQAAVERLEKGRDGGVWSRADDHEHLALRAYLKVRGKRPCLLPASMPTSAPLVTTNGHTEPVADDAQQVSPNGALEGSASTVGTRSPHSAGAQANENP